MKAPHHQPLAEGEKTSLTDIQEQEFNRISSRSRSSRWATRRSSTISVFAKYEKGLDQNRGRQAVHFTLANPRDKKPLKNYKECTHTHFTSHHDAIYFVGTSSSTNRSVAPLSVSTRSLGGVCSCICVMVTVASIERGARTH